MYETHPYVCATDVKSKCYEGDEDNGVEVLLGLCGGHIQVLFGYFRCTALIQSCEGLIAWVGDMVSIKNVKTKSPSK